MNNDLEYIEDGHIYIYKGEVLPSVTEIMSVKFGDKYDRVPPQVLENARQRGKEIHKAIEEYIENNVENEKHKEVISDFRYILHNYSLEVVNVETPLVVFDDNNVPVCAGRLDLIVKDSNGDLGIADIKTTSKLDIDYLEYQLNLYKMGYEKTYQQDIKFLSAIWLRKDKRKYEKIKVDLEKAKEIIDLYKEGEINDEQSDFDW